MTAESTARHGEPADHADSDAQAETAGEIFEGPRSSTLLTAAVGLAMLAAGVWRLSIAIRAANGEDVDLGRLRGGSGEMTLQSATILAVVAVIVGLLVVGYALVTYFRRRRIRMTPEHLVIERRRGAEHQAVRELAWREVKRLEPQHGRHGPFRPGPRLVEIIIRNQLPESVALQEWEAAVAFAELHIEAARADPKG